MKHLKNQNGSAAVVALVIIGIISAALVIIGIGSYISAYNYGNKLDNRLIAIKENNKNIYANGTQKVLEIAQVPGMYKDDFSSIIKADIEGRYGKDGSKATFQFLKEHDIKLDVALYAKIQQAIEGFRNEFQANQTQLIDVKRSYQTGLGSFWQGMWLRMAGYPKINLAEYNAITTDSTESVFKVGKESGPLKLR